MAHAQISPGPLARAHQSLAGDTSCTKCHEVSTRAPSFKCLECHKEIAGELQRNHGLHATYPRSGPTGAACVKCHSDHNGLDFNMIRWDPTPKGFEQVFEISERLDADGDVVVALSEAELDAAIDRFAAEGIQAVAIVFLWSFVNPIHEQQAAARIRERCPGLFVTCSYEVAPRIGEYPRMVSTVMNAQIGPLMVGYIDLIVEGARARGFDGEVLFGHSEGGLVPAEEAAHFPSAPSSPVRWPAWSARP